jgi:hypothetical protein
LIKILSPLIIYLIELEISRQVLGKLENVNWGKPLTEHNRYAAVMLLSDVRRRVHYEMKYVDLPQRIYLEAQREFERVQEAIDVLGKLDIWGAADQIDNSTEAGLTGLKQRFGESRVDLMAYGRTQ